MNLEGAIFDLDGTLLDSMYIWDTLGADYLLSRGIKPRENLNKTFKTMSLKQAAKYYQIEYGIKDSIDEIMNGVNKMVEHFYMNDAFAKEGVIECLDYLYNKGVKMCIATATDRYMVEPALKRNNMTKYFSKIFTCTEVGLGKDNPTIYFKALEHLQTNKENTFIFEDSLYAVKTAKKSEFKVVGVYDKAESENQSELKKKVDIYINSFSEMRDCLD